MKKIAFIALLLASTSVSASDAAFYLQLGSFETKDQAEQRWQELKAKNPSTLGTLSMHVSQVSMMGDAVSYRTQAGPIDSRDHANDLCSKLSDTGAECYVVETAMLSNDTSPTAEAGASSTTVEAEPFAPSVKPETSGTPAPVLKSQTVTSGYVPGREPHFLDGDSKLQPVESAQATSTYAASSDDDTPAPAARKSKHHETVSSDEYSDYDRSSSPAAQRLSDPFAHHHRTKTAAAPVQVASAEPETAPTPAQAKKPGFFSRLFGGSSSSEAAKPAPTPAPYVPQAPAPVASNNEGNVSVAEAIRVPLTSGDSAGAGVTAARQTPIENMRATRAAYGSDSYWAQISYFPDEASAQNFYDTFENTYPDISEGVRMRITRPYSTGSSYGGKVTLRMGTFANASDVQIACAMAQERNLSCTSVKSRGSEVAEKVPSGYLANNGHVSYWVQLGSFESKEDALDKWKSVQKADKKIVNKLKANVTQPESADTDHKLYRLRVGPFSSRPTADSVCNKLEGRGENCLVVDE